MNNVLITGGCGFIGHHVVEHLLINTDWNLVIIDKLSYASMGFERLKDPIFEDNIRSNRLKIITWDLINEISIGLAKELSKINIIIHMAAETHVDNSIQKPQFVIQNNVMSTVNLLEFAKTLQKLEIFFYFSTDEVYGPALNNKLYYYLLFSNTYF